VGIGSGDTPAPLGSTFEAIGWKQAPRAAGGARDRR